MVQSLEILLVGHSEQKMKLSVFVCTLFFVFGPGESGLVKDIFGTIHQEIHTVVDKAVNTIGKVTHKIHEPLGVFVHRKENDSTNVPQSGKKESQSTPIPKIEPHVDQTGENSEKNHNDSIPNNVKTDTKNASDNNYHEQSTASTADQITTVDTVDHLNMTASKDNGKNKAESSNVAEDILVSNDIKLEDILSVALHNATHFKEVDLFAINAVRGSFPNNNTNDLTNNTSIITNEGASNKTERESNLDSEQMLFPDRINDFKKQFKGCSNDLVKSEDEDCLEQIDTENSIKKNVDLGSVFEAPCPWGYYRALDKSCQPNLGLSRVKL